MIEYTVKVNDNGDTEWYVNDQLHREDGPAFEFADGSKEWWINEKRHREDGPAIEYANGYKAWWINGVELTEEEFNNRNVQELTVAEISERLGYPVKVVKG